MNVYITYEGVRVHLSIFYVGRTTRRSQQYQEYDAHCTHRCQSTKYDIPSFHVDVGFALELYKDEQIAEEETGSNNYDVYVNLLKKNHAYYHHLEIFMTIQHAMILNLFKYNPNHECHLQLFRYSMYHKVYYDDKWIYIFLLSCLGSQRGHEQSLETRTVSTTNKYVCTQLITIM